MRIVNLTPHPLNFYDPDTPDQISDPSQGLLRTIESAEQPARLSMDEKGGTSQMDGIPTVDVVYGDAGAVPEPQPGTAFVVSLVTGLALVGRGDIFVPYREVRGPSGSVIGCRALARPCTKTKE